METHSTPSSGQRCLLSRSATVLFPGVALFTTCLAHADFAPIPLTAGSFTQDAVVEKNAPKAPASLTTASMDAGTGNTGYTWYEQGFDASAPFTGLPPAGSIFVSE